MICMHNLYLICRGDGGEYLEYHYTVKIPVQVLKNKNAALRMYKYHVESSGTEMGVLESIELISGPDSNKFHRSLKHHANRGEYL